MSTVTKVKPCPFCGSANICLAEMVRSALFSTKVMGRSVECQECGANTPGETKENAIEKWNARHVRAIQ